MTAWFNTMFNGQEAMDKRLEEMESSHQDNYFETLSVNPYDEFKIADKTDVIEAPDDGGWAESLMGGNLNGGASESSRAGFEKAEEKALKVIANHSMIIKGEERNKMISRAYLMLGQARYYQGKAFQALDALEQVKRLPFDKYKPIAEYYMALANIQAGNKFGAANILDKLYQNNELDKQLIANIAKEYAWLYYEDGDLISALNGLDRAIEFSRSKKERARLNFIQGQLLSKLGRLDEANAKFNEAYKLKPGFEMEARAMVFSILNFDPKIHSYQSFNNQVEKLYNTGTYEKYRNEFLYALGKVEEKRDSVQLAERIYKEALLEKESSPRFRAETYAALGDLKMNKEDYVYAKAYYDSANSVVPAGSRKEEIQKLSNNLKNVIDKYYLVKRNDSILKLTKMAPDARTDYFKKHIEKLKEIDAKKAEEKASSVEETKFLTDLDNKNGFFQNTGNQRTFYFYSNSAKINGQSEFKKLWGNRSLKDNWRLSNSGEISIEQKKAELTGNVGLNNPRRYDVDFYIEQIPVDVVEIQNLKQERDTVELSLGVDYIEQFKNVKRATETLEHLVNTPPMDDEVLLKAYYNLYRINVSKNKSLSDKYKNLVLNKFPNSIYAEYILNPQVDFTVGNDTEIVEMYKKAYEAYKDGKYDEVKALTQSAFDRNQKAEIIAKFMFLNANIDAKLKGKEAYMEALERIAVLYPEKEEGIRAKELIAKLSGDKKENKADNSNKTPIKKKEDKKVEQKDTQDNVFDDDDDGQWNDAGFGGQF